MSFRGHFGKYNKSSYLKRIYKTVGRTAGVRGDRNTFVYPEWLVVGYDQT